MHKQHGLSGSLLLALVLAAGTMIVWGVVSSFCGEAIRQRQFRQRPLAERTREWLILSKDGTPMIASDSRFDTGKRLYRTLDGEPVESTSETVWFNHLPGPDALELDGLPVQWSTRIRGVSDLESAPSYWYLIHDGRPKGHAWLEGFDRATKQRVGYLGRNGFRASPPTPGDLFRMEWRVFQASGHFPYAGRFAHVPYRELNWRMGMGGVPPWVGYLVTDGRRVEVDVRERRVRVLFEAPGLVSAVVVTRVNTDVSALSSNSRNQFIVVRSTDRFWMIDPDTNQSQELAIPAPLSSSAIGISVVDDRILLTNGARGWLLVPERAPPTKTAILVWLSQDGHVLQERSVRLRSFAQPKPRAWAQVTAVPVPMAVALNIFMGDPLNELDGTVRRAHVQVVSASWHRYRGPFLALCLLSIALAVWCFRRHRRYAQAGAWAWSLFVLLLGVPGLIGYLLHRHWPIREPCPACGRRAVMERETCQHCSAPFPTPSLQGIEVFG